jgi:hypothetical protein
VSRHHSKRATSDRVDLGRPKPTFIGFAEGDTDLYEFHTSSGEYVYVHDMECIGIDFRPLTAGGQLALRDEFSDQRNVAPEDLGRLGLSDPHGSTLDRAGQTMH